MKKLFSFFVMLGAFAFMTSCSSSSSGDGGQQPVQPTGEETFTNNYFSVQNSTFHQGAIPAPSTGATALETVTMNTSALANGSNFINISSAQALQSFLIGVQGVDGYIEVPAATVTRATGTQEYSIPLVYGAGYGSNIIIIVEGVTTDGHVTLPFSQAITFVENQYSGELHVNLTFDNAKDIDLHLITPSGTDIYYSNRTISTTVGTETIQGGLDHDSNAGCTIDNLNNENIVLPAALIEPGVYTVQIDMWSNCATDVYTDWTITARYQGVFLQNLFTLPTAAENAALVQAKKTDIESSYTTKNPVHGRYPVGAISNRNNPEGRQTVMKFQVVAAPAAAPRITQSYVPSDMDQMKMEEETWYRNGTLK